MEGAMKKVRPCTVCGKMTTRFLFNDKLLDIPACSKKCEYEYFNTLTPGVREQMNTVLFIDNKISKTKRNEIIGWMIAGLGLFMVAAGFLIANVTLFFAGVFPLTCGALSTSHFGSKRNNLLRQRKQIAI